MRDGFISVAAVSPAVKVADCTWNTRRIIQAMDAASSQGISLLVFPELSVTGYTCGDLFLQDALLAAVQESLAAIVSHSTGIDTVAVVGAPLVWRNKLYNCAVVIHHGHILGVVPKTNIPNYQEFYELRWFAPAPDGIDTLVLAGQEVPFGTRLLFSCTSVTDFIFAVEICEDLWVPMPPSASHAMAGATVMVNLSASDEVVGKDGYRRNLVASQSARLACAYIYCDAGYGESTTDLVFTGHDLVAENGHIVAEHEGKADQLLRTEVDVAFLARERRLLSTFPQTSGDYRTIFFSQKIGETVLTRTVARYPFVPADSADLKERCAKILSLQAQGLAKRLEHTRSTGLVLGLSGGLDSTLALLVSIRAVDALGMSRKNILAISMPGFGTTKRTKGNATQLAKAMGVSFQSISIAAAVRRHFIDIGQDCDIHDVTYENSQARERTQILMDVANKNNMLVVGTGDLSELALGWATYNGDHMSMYGVNASIPKTLVRHLVRYVADESDETLGKVLLDVLDTPVSPELLPADSQGKISQVTEDIVGPYELHDFFLYAMMRKGFSPSKVFRLACRAFEETYDRTTILSWLTVFYRRFFSQQFKRSVLPDGPKVGTVTLSPRGDWRMPSDAQATIWLDELILLRK
ncbi:NAD(+) synthase [Parasphaerochaeta coccoides]|uniref:Glutamine-dependent NAD(+) synthetase n=1 Tax=Parasphaerochaeta coccoides (strain ATCC BAA-1237 / DSM 17374 / SPN1) TaxID=760011 RepID=F4GHG6_PARC1|nr:NAD(+) synthase [Parasphaerochaeta coccoides]AEC02555.1 NAD+ synthetase [Parasphaerochaeta coccoides DSM 17374]